MSAAPDTEHEEWLRGEEERGRLHAHAHVPVSKPPPGDGAKKPAVVPDGDEAQEEEDDATDDAAEDLLAEANQENLAEGTV